ncbi:MAG: radical SAM protein [Acutalibacteraceae bacterium]|uniref:radical SAM protein n=1 Tax=Ruminococcus sp. TaxID=41978 RepID=UPI002E772ABE|nr:radical SAM protein [Ruminococcus sp.]MEE1057436.1 radical SAM protein [Acutalibacteraceae bacterium]MEE1263722.1 radical SAM protein [Ruminococcus sp.]
MKTNNLTISADIYGCPNRCKHCWLGHMPNRKMPDGSDEMIVNYFKPHFHSITFYSWVREPDYCENYVERWQRDIQISVNAKPQRFELASFWRLVRDKNYVRFLKSVGVNKVQLTFFGTEEITDWYIGRKGAYQELLRATEILIKNKIAPRWQVFISTKNATDIIKLLSKSKELNLSERCKDFGEKFSFFIHSGSCDGENRKLYPFRINREDILAELIPYYNNFSETKTEAELCEFLAKDSTCFAYHNENEITLNIANSFDVYFNFTHMRPEWKIGNILTDKSSELVRRIINEDIPALRVAKNTPVSKLVKQFGDPQSHKIFDCVDDYKAYLLNEMIRSQF